MTEKIDSTARYEFYLAEVERLVAQDPGKDTPEGKRLIELAALVEIYEKEHYPITGEKATAMRLADAEAVIEAVRGFMLRDVNLVEEGLNRFKGLPGEDYSSRFILGWQRVAVHLCILARSNNCSGENLKQFLQQAVTAAEVLFSRTDAAKDD